MARKIIDVVKIVAMPDVVSGNAMSVRVSVEWNGVYKSVFDVKLETDQFHSDFERIMQQAFKALEKELKEAIVNG